MITLNNIKQVVKRLLTNIPDLRDDDTRVMANVWYQEALKNGLTYEQVRPFLDLLSSGKLTNSESIRRSRQKIQEECPELRGKHYKQKQNHQYSIKKELGY